MATRLLITSEQAFCLSSCSVARALVIAPLLIAFLPPAFMDFMGGSILLGKTRFVPRFQGGEKDDLWR